VVIALENISKTFAGHTVFTDVSLLIAPGNPVVLSGPSGAGKSTLLRIIAGLDNPDSGRIQIDGITANSPDSLLAPHKRGIGVAFQKAALWPHMNVKQNLAFVVGGLNKPERLARMQYTTQLCAIEPLLHRFPDTLSAGQARRVALARVLIFQPRYMLLDEPTSNLDAKAREAVNEVILSYVTDKQAGLLYISHDEGDIAQIGGNRYVLEQGELALASTAR